MRVGIVFHKNPLAPPTGIDLVRLRAISLGFIRKGIDAEVIAPIDREGILEGIVPVRRLEALEEAGRYDIVKTCYHDSILLIERYRGPVVSRIVRVVDHELPERDEPFRERLLRCQGCDSRSGLRCGPEQRGEPGALEEFLRRRAADCPGSYGLSRAYSRAGVKSVQAG